MTAPEDVVARVIAKRWGMSPRNKDVRADATAVLTTLAAAGLLADSDVLALVAEVERLRFHHEQAVRDEAAALGEAGAAERERDALAARLAAVAAPDEREATPDEAHDIGYAKGHIDGYREAMAEVATRPAPTVNAAQVEATADYLHVEPLRLRWALAALGLTVTDEVIEDHDASLADAVEKAARVHRLDGISEVFASCECGESATIEPEPGWSSSWEALTLWHAQHLARAALDAAGVDALRSEIERLRETVGRLIDARHADDGVVRERDEARQQVAALRARIEETATYTERFDAALEAMKCQTAPYGWVSTTAGDERGEIVCWFSSDRNAAAWVASQDAERLGTPYEYVVRPAPVVPDSTGLRGRVARAVVEHSRCEFIVTGETAQATCGMPLPEGLPFAATAGDAHVADAVLAVVGQGVTAEPITFPLDRRWKPGEQVEVVLLGDVRPALVERIEKYLKWHDRLVLRFEDGEVRAINPDVVRHLRPHGRQVRG